MPITLISLKEMTLCKLTYTKTCACSCTCDGTKIMLQSKVKAEYKLSRSIYV